MSRTVIPFVPRRPPPQGPEPQSRFLRQLARFFYSQAAQADLAIDLTDRIAEKLFTENSRVSEARRVLSEVRWRSINEDQIATALGQLSRDTIEVMLRSMYEALHTRLRCDHWIDVTSVYHFNPRIRELMLRLQPFRSWLAHDFFVAKDVSHRQVSPFVSKVMTLFERELRRLRRAGYLESDTAVKPPFQIHLHKTMPHLGFLLVEFPDRLEACELNQVTETIVGEFAYVGGILTRARLLPLASCPAWPIEKLPEGAERSTKVVLGRLAQHLFLATDDAAPSIGELFERVFVCSFIQSAAPDSSLGRVTVSAFEQKRWSRDLERTSTPFDLDDGSLTSFHSLVDHHWAMTYADLLDDPSPIGRVVRPFQGPGIDATMDDYRELYFAHILQSRRLLLSWYSEQLLAEYAVEGSPSQNDAPASLRVKTDLLLDGEGDDDLASFWQIDRVDGVADMSTETVFIREPERGTVRIVVTGGISNDDGQPSSVELFPVEVRLPLNDADRP